MPPEPTIHRATGPFPASTPYAFEARCGPARFEGGFTEPMRVTHRRSEVTCTECRMTALDWAWLWTKLLVFLGGLAAVAVAERAWAWLRYRRRPVRHFGRPESERVH